MLSLQELLQRIITDSSVSFVLFRIVIVAASLVNVIVNLCALRCYKFLCCVITVSYEAVFCFFGI